MVIFSSNECVCVEGKKEDHEPLKRSAKEASVVVLSEVALPHFCDQQFYVIIKFICDQNGFNMAFCVFYVSSQNKLLAWEPNT